jgi:hypothetical protein
MVSLLTEVNDLVSSAPVGIFTLDLLAASIFMKGNIPIFPENVSFPCASNLGLACAAKNMTFSILPDASLSELI